MLCGVTSPVIAITTHTCSQSSAGPRLQIPPPKWQVNLGWCHLARSFPQPTSSCILCSLQGMPKFVPASKNTNNTKRPSPAHHTHDFLFRDWDLGKLKMLRCERWELNCSSTTGLSGLSVGYSSLFLFYFLSKCRIWHKRKPFILLWKVGMV